MFRKLLLGTALATFAAIGSANALLIDNFNQPNTRPFQTTFVGDDGVQPTATFDDSLITTFLTSDVIGGSRYVATTLVSPLTPGQYSETFTSQTGYFTHGQQPNTTAKTSITWDANGAGLNANLLADGADRFLFTVAQADAGLEWALEVCDTGTDCATVTFDTVTAIVLGSPETREVTFAQLLADNAALTLGSIASITFTANNGGVPNLDTSIDEIRTVPEPATMTVLGLGLAGIGLLARRRRKAA